MPEISRFYGIIIRVYYRDHPPAHFHAIYGEHEALVEIETGTIYRGELPRTARELVNRWRQLHVSELMEDWDRARDFQPILPIAPLD
jgi:Domain of unknown function (DUF4160)